MKSTLKLILVLCLFSSVTFAEGEYPLGGKTNGEMTSGGFTEGQIPAGGFTSGDIPNGDKVDGNMGNGGVTEGEYPAGGRTVNNPSQTNFVLDFIQKYLGSMFG